jgi:hypothetical protein
MKVGVPAKISTDDTASGQPITGAITRTSDAVNPQARTFRVEVDILNADRRLVPGLYVQVAFQLENGSASQVPAAALVFQAGGPKVAVVDSDGTVHFRAVTIARDDGDRVELSSGVSDNDRLVLNISNQIVDGEKVRVSNDTRPVPVATTRAH